MQLKANIHTRFYSSSFGESIRPLDEQLPKTSGISGLMKRYTCVPNLVSFHISRDEVIQSDVEIYEALTPIAAGTRLDLGLFTDGKRNNKSGYRKRILEETGSKCDCDLCEYEDRNSAFPSTGKYYPIACPDCRSLMVRADDNPNNFNCSVERCHKKMSINEIKIAYDLVEKLYTELWANVPDTIATPFGFAHIDHDQLDSTARKMEGLLARSSEDLARIHFEVGETMTNLIDLSGPAGQRRILTALEHLEKSLDIYDEIAGGPDADSRDKCMLLKRIVSKLGPQIHRVGRGDFEVRYNQLVARVKRQGSPSVIIDKSFPTLSYNLNID